MNHGGDAAKDAAAKSSKVKRIVGKIRGLSHGQTCGDGDKSSQSSCLPLKNRGQREDNSGQVSLDLWNAAYDALRNDAGSSGLVQAYEAIISQELPSDQKQGMNTSLSVHPPEKRLELLTTITSAGVTKGLGSKASQVDESARKILDYSKETIRSLLPSYPSTPLAWAGLCTLTPLLLDPLLRQEHIKDGLMYVTARISRFMSISAFLSPDLWEDHQDFRTLEAPTRHTILDLYRKVLEFEMNCVCATASAWNIAAKNVVDWHGWGAMIAAIQELDELMARDVAKYGSQKAKERLLGDAENMGNVLAAEVRVGGSSGSISPKRLGSVS